MPNSLDQLQQQLGYRFSDSSLLHIALTHRSFSAEHNERLEFLGDSLVNMLVAELLFEHFVSEPEGVLTQQRALLVRGVTLAEIAKEFELGQYLKLGSGEIKTGGNQRESILADTVEAIIAAIYLDSDFSHCRQCVRQWYLQRVESINTATKVKDAKTRLQELLQAKGKKLPEYTVLAIDGAQHDQNFTIACKVALLPKGVEATAKSRKKAEQLAAAQVLTTLGEVDGD